MKPHPLAAILLVVTASTGCEVLQDTEFNPTYFLECVVDGTAFRAETNMEAYRADFPQLENQYEVIGQDQASDFQLNLTLFEELGEGETCVGEQVGIYVTDISLFTEGRTFTAWANGGAGCVDVTVLTESEVEGTFFGTVKDLDDPNVERTITEGRFKVRTSDN